MNTPHFLMVPFLFAAAPEAAITGARPDLGPMVGIGPPAGFALQGLGANLLIATAPEASAALKDLVAAWRSAGRPGLDQLRGVATHADGGWDIRLASGGKAALGDRPAREAECAADA